jgi:phenylacetate-CoA ligase
VPDARWSPASAVVIEHGLRARLGETCRVTLRVVDAIPAAASGKYRYVVSHVPLPSGLDASQKDAGARVPS